MKKWKETYRNYKFQFPKHYPSCYWKILGKWMCWVVQMFTSPLQGGVDNGGAPMWAVHAFSWGSHKLPFHDGTYGCLCLAYQSTNMVFKLTYNWGGAPSCTNHMVSIPWINSIKGGPTRCRFRFQCWWANDESLVVYTTDSADRNMHVWIINVKYLQVFIGFWSLCTFLVIPDIHHWTICKKKLVQSG